MHRHGTHPLPLLVSRQGAPTAHFHERFFVCFVFVLVTETDSIEDITVHMLLELEVQGVLQQRKRSAIDLRTQPPP